MRSRHPECGASALSLSTIKLKQQHREPLRETYPEAGEEPSGTSHIDPIDPEEVERQQTTCPTVRPLAIKRLLQLH
jgi:hypothetical protein